MQNSDTSSIIQLKLSTTIFEWSSKITLIMFNSIILGSVIYSSYYSTIPYVDFFQHSSTNECI